MDSVKTMGSQGRVKLTAIIKHAMPLRNCQVCVKKKVCNFVSQVQMAGVYDPIFWRREFAEETPRKASPVHVFTSTFASFSHFSVSFLTIHILYDASFYHQKLGIFHSRWLSHIYSPITTLFFSSSDYHSPTPVNLVFRPPLARNPYRVSTGYPWHGSGHAEQYHSSLPARRWDDHCASLCKT